MKKSWRPPGEDERALNPDREGSWDAGDIWLTFCVGSRLEDAIVLFREMTPVKNVWQPQLYPGWGGWGGLSVGTELNAAGPLEEEKHLGLSFLFTLPHQRLPRERVGVIVSKTNR